MTKKLRPAPKHQKKTMTMMTKHRTKTEAAKKTTTALTVYSKIRPPGTFERKGAYCSDGGYRFSETHAERRTPSR